MKSFRVCLAALLFAFPQAGNAADISTGEDIREACLASERVSECLTFLEVVYRTAKAIAHMSGAERRGVVGSCGPDKGIDTVPLVIAMRNAWQAYAGKYPEQLRDRAAEATLRAYEEQWPCER